MMLETPSTPLVALGLDQLAVHAFELEVVSGPDKGRKFRSRGDTAVLGTHRSADLVLTDRTVSRLHCEISISDGIAHVKDLGSRNGTRIGTLAISSGRLDGPALLQLGETEIRFGFTGECVHIPLAPQEKFGPLVGQSSAMRAAFVVLQRAAETDVAVVIEGDAGTGKSAAARAIHEASARRDGPFGVVDCSQPRQILEAELFGHGDRSGAFELCRGGTLVLDDVGALPAATQAALLDAIDAHAEHDVRLIATTRRNLRRDINAGRMRSDLYYMLAIMHVQLPRLRDREDDIPVLVSVLLERLGATDHIAAADLRKPDTVDELQQYAWPANVRELKTYVERRLASYPLGAAVADAVDDRLQPPPIDGSMPLREARDQWVDYFERIYLLDLLARTEHNVTAAAKIAGVDRVHLHRLITRRGLRRK